MSVQWHRVSELNWNASSVAPCVRAAMECQFSGTVCQSCNGMSVQWSSHRSCMTYNSTCLCSSCVLWCALSAILLWCFSKESSLFIALSHFLRKIMNTYSARGVSVVGITAHIREVVGSILDHETGCADEICSWLLRQCLQTGHLPLPSTSFAIHYSSLLLPLRHCIFWATDCIIS